MSRFSPVALAAVLFLGTGGVALAQALPGTSLRNYDRNAVIDVDAARIEVREQQGQALFSGQVKVEQGSLNLDADRIRVFYETTGNNLQIDRLDAEGGVSVRTPAETARATNAIYDVQTSQITMIGNVVLERGSDLLRGQRLVIDLGSGRSTFDGQVNAAPGSAGRVSGRFTPRTSE